LDSYKIILYTSLVESQLHIFFKMIKSITEKNPLIEIDLTGADGNAFALLAHAKRIGYLMGLSEEEVEAVLKEMRSGDYENLIKVFEENFGDFVVLYR